MSTRSNVVIIEESGFPMENIMKLDDDCNTILYHHWDGYPENMMEILKECILDSDWDGIVIRDNLLNYDDDFREEDMVSGDIDWLYIIDIERQMIRYLNVWGDTQYFYKNGEPQTADNRIRFGIDEG